MNKYTLTAVVLFFSCFLFFSCPSLFKKNDSTSVTYLKESGYMIVDGQAFAQGADVPDITASSTERTFEFVPDASRGWSFSSWATIQPAASIFGYPSVQLLAGNPVTISADEVFVTGNSSLMPHVDRFTVENAYYDESGSLCLVVAYPGGRRAAFTCDSQGRSAVNITPRFIDGEDWRIIAYAGGKVFIGEPEGRSFYSIDPATGIAAPLAEGLGSSLVSVSPSGIYYSVVSYYIKDGEPCGFGRIDIYRTLDSSLVASIDPGDGSVDSDLSLDDSGLFYCARGSAPDTVDVLRLDFATGATSNFLTTGIHDFRFMYSVAGPGSRAVLKLHPEIIRDGSAQMGSTRFYLLDPASPMAIPLSLPDGGYLGLRAASDGSSLIYLNFSESSAGTRYRLTSYDCTTNTLTTILDRDTSPLAVIGGKVLFLDSVRLPSVPYDPSPSFASFYVYEGDSSYRDITPYAAILESAP